MNLILRHCAGYKQFFFLITTQLMLAKGKIQIGEECNLILPGRTKGIGYEVQSENVLMSRKGPESW